MNEKRRKNIGLLFKRSMYRIQMGIVNYAKEAGWVIDYTMLQYNKTPKDYLNWEIDGIISHHLGSESIKALIKDNRVPTVDLGPYNKELDIPSVFMDNRAIAEMAGRNLVSKGFENIGYIKHYGVKSRSGLERYKSLQKYIQEKGRSFFTLDSRSFLTQLKEIPKPVALMGENDRYTSDYVRQCLNIGYKIPYEVAFISVNNDPLFCDVAGVPLTSIDINMEERGYRAAEILDRLMNGEKISDKMILIPPKRVVERESTSILAIPHMPTYKALKYIHDNFNHRSLSVTEVVKLSGMCRRRLEDNFRRYVGHSMPNEILRLRCDNAKRLLRDSDLKVYEIAEECGFSSSENMTKTFKRLTGKTPKSYRLN